MTDTAAETEHRPGEITIRGTRYIWERHASDAHVIDLVMLQDESQALAACGALVLAYPRFAKRARFKRSVSRAAAVLYELLVEAGWEVGDILRAGMHAFAWLSDRLPINPRSEEVEEAVDFTEPPPEITPGG
jgi:hypothetical protein